MNNHPIRKEKVPLKVRTLNVLIVKVWDTMLKFVLAPKILKILCR